MALHLLSPAIICGRVAHDRRSIASIRSMRFLAMDFREAITSKDCDGMVHWIRTAAQSGIGPLVRFAYGLKQDFNAVLAAVETSWSNG